MPLGDIISLVEEKGFGFIKPRDGGDDIFFHNSAVRGAYEDLSLGQVAEYEMDTEADKPRAKSVVGTSEIRPIQNRGGSSGHRAAGKFDRNSSSNRRGQKPRTPANAEKGFVTKLLMRKREGFISPDKGGQELRFAASSVHGEKRYDRLKVGDYVQFIRIIVPENKRLSDEDMGAISIEAIEREPRKLPKCELPSNPKRRGKKPSWR
jgi:cold shock CspA family protein